MTSSHHALLELKNMGLSRDNPQARETVALILHEEKGRDGGLNPATSVKASDTCVNGMALGYAACFGASQERLASIVDLLLAQRTTCSSGGEDRTAGGRPTRVTRALPPCGRSRPEHRAPGSP